MIITGEKYKDLDLRAVNNYKYLFILCIIFFVFTNTTKSNQQNTKSDSLISFWLKEIFQINQIEEIDFLNIKEKKIKSLIIRKYQINFFNDKISDTLNYEIQKYLYNDFGNVLKITKKTFLHNKTQVESNEYYYQYDNRNRLISCQKKTQEGNFSNIFSIIYQNDRVKQIILNNKKSEFYYQGDELKMIKNYQLEDVINYFEFDNSRLLRKYISNLFFFNLLEGSKILTDVIEYDSLGRKIFQMHIGNNIPDHIDIPNKLMYCYNDSVTTIYTVPINGDIGNCSNTQLLFSEKILFNNGLPIIIEQCKRNNYIDEFIRFSYEFYE